MTRGLATLALAVVSLSLAQTNSPEGQTAYYGAAEVKDGPARSAAIVLPSDRVFPHMATGSGWETLLVIVNMGTRTVTFDQNFYDQAGRPMQITSRSVPGNEVFTTSVATGTLPPGHSLNVLLYDRGQPLQVGWSSLNYDSTLDRLGGFSIFRSIVPGRPDFEAVVPLSAVDDYKFFMPFDNLEGFVTAMALLNAGTIPTDAVLTLRNTNGVLIERATIRLDPGNQTAFAISDRFPLSKGRIGSLYIEGSTNRLSSLGFRFSPGGAFATIPIMNWVGMFP